jgi:hypothetical protein
VEGLICVVIEVPSLRRVRGEFYFVSNREEIPIKMQHPKTIEDVAIIGGVNPVLVGSI